MKVLFLTNIPSPYRVDFFNELGKKCKLTVLYELESATDRDRKWRAETSNNFKEVFLKGKMIGSDSALCFSVLKYLKDNQYDVIVIGGYSTPTGMLAIQFLKLINRPFILNCDGGMVKNDSKIKYKIKKYFIGSANYWLSSGRSTTEYLLNYGAKKENIFVYPFTSIKECDILKSVVSEQEKQNIKNKLGIKEKKIIISVGQFIYRKGFDILIEAMTYLSNEYGVYIIGGNVTQEYLELKNKNNLENIHFIDFRIKEELKEYYKSADLFILPTREDIWGLVINEAMANGLPVITTDKCIAGLELIEDKVNGMIIKSGDPEKLSQGINSIFDETNDIKKMQYHSIKKINEYTIEKMAEKHLNIFRKIIGEI